MYHGLRYAIPTMLAGGGGTIVNISSGAATSALEGWSHYCATKAAVLALTRVADLEYRSQGIRVVGLSPGTVATCMQEQIKASAINPVSRLEWSSHIPPQWVAQAIAWLTTKEADLFLGSDFSLKTNEGRRAVGLPAIVA
ncbi:SDR family oxidoreductase [Devosia sp.]|uniref:SDR family oxidoreductase n=1 Tax=Devosia sp. TaxID=1871048 RepID=UPI0025CF438D|nr:SDR family oxidoreductase [Devosia sp.]MCR6633481.1 SDR family oxidoreductase [Devosia sp.]